jgi:hypothetical protein
MTIAALPRFCAGQIGIAHDRLGQRRNDRRVWLECLLRLTTRPAAARHGQEKQGAER